MKNYTGNTIIGICKQEESRLKKIKKKFKIILFRSKSSTKHLDNNIFLF